MPLSSQARGTASRASHSTGLERLTRAGLIGYGIVHLLFAWLIVQLALGGSRADGDRSGGLHELAGKRYGTVLIAVIVVGPAAMVVRQAPEAAAGHRSERGRHRVCERVASGGRAMFYAYFAWTGVKVLCGKSARPVPTPRSRPGRT